MCVQPTFLIGTFNEDGTPNFAPITWVSVTYGDDYMLVISMNGSKRTKQNIARSGMFAANLVSTDMIDLLNYFGSSSGMHGAKDQLPHQWETAVTVDAPTLNNSRYVYECKIAFSVQNGETTTYFAPIKNIQVMEDACASVDKEKADLLKLNPVVYSGGYYAIGADLEASH
jgi:flavin reductase (DIM6/NTAB) family NADH-FMN oxidoreductase RutF